MSDDLQDLQDFHDIMMSVCVSAAPKDFRERLPSVGWVTQAEAEQAEIFIESEMHRILDQWPIDGQTKH